VTGVQTLLFRSSGVGVSFGAERIYDVMDELGLFPKDDRQNLKLLFVTFDEDNFMYAYKALLKVRQAGINAELFPEPTKMKKQMKYANARNVPFVAVVGNNEMNDGVYAVKNMETGVQEKYDLAALIELLK
jgi:histidyl-tRNA synthetase